MSTHVHPLENASEVPVCEVMDAANIAAQFARAKAMKAQRLVETRSHFEFATAGPDTDEPEFDELDVNALMTLASRINYLSSHFEPTNSAGINELGKLLKQVLADVAREQRLRDSAGLYQIGWDYQHRLIERAIHACTSGKIVPCQFNDGEEDEAGDGDDDCGKDFGVIDVEAPPPAPANWRRWIPTTGRQIGIGILIGLGVYEILNFVCHLF